MKSFHNKKKTHSKKTHAFSDIFCSFFFYSIACYDLRFRNLAIALLEVWTGTNSNCMGISLSSDIASGASNLADSFKKKSYFDQFHRIRFFTYFKILKKSFL